MSKFPDTTYTDVHIYKADQVYVSGVYDELAEKMVDHAAVLRLKGGKWRWRGSGGYALRGMCASKRGRQHTLLNLGTDGTVIEFLFPGEREEQIDTSEEGPSDLVHMRAMRRIGEHVFAVGMARHAYRRDGEDNWTAIDAGVFVPRSKRKNPFGFNALCGFSEHEIYAAGMLGEIWSYDGNGWTQEPSPTNVALNAMTTTSGGDVCVVGLAGVVTVGKRGAWRAIEQSATDEDFWGVTAFGERVFMSTREGVYALNTAGNDLEQVDLGLGEEFTTAYLDAADGVMWSVGDKDLARTKDGVKWERVPGPP